MRQKNTRQLPSSTGVVKPMMRNGPPGPAAARVGDVEPAIGRRGLGHHLGPVEVLVLLLDPGDDEAVRGLLDPHLILLGAERQA